MRLKVRSLVVAVCGFVVVLGGCGDDGGGPTAPFIRVTSPNGGGSLYYDGDDALITWASHDVTDVDLYYSTNSGGNWTPIDVTVPNTGSYAWPVPTAPSAFCLVRVEEAGGAGPTDDSDALFTIAPVVLQLTAPNAGGVWRIGDTLTASWNSLGFANLKVEFSRNGLSWTDIDPAADAAAGTVNWTVTGPGSSNCFVRISDPNDGVPTATSAVAFSVAEIVVVKPVGGETWYYEGTDQNIQWTGFGLPGAVDIHYSTDNGASWGNVVALNTANDGLHTWQIPNTLGPQCLVRVRDAGDVYGVSDVSDATFEIIQSTITVTPPAGGEDWLEWTDHTISWSVPGGVTTVRIDVSRDGGNVWQTVASSVPAAPPDYLWTVRNPSSSICLVRVADQGEPAHSRVSPAPFTISPLFGLKQSLTGVENCDLAWGDYDSDGDLDLVVSGHNGSTGATALYKYDDVGGTFSPDAAAAFAGANNASLAWGDYDGNGEIDVILSGDASGGMRLYQNTSGVFAEAVGHGIDFIRNGDLAWGDWDNDGDLDIAVAGRKSISPQTVIADIFVNAGGSFAAASAGITPTEWSALAWADYDNDGDLDLAYSGDTERLVTNPSMVPFTRIYRNGVGSLADSGEAVQPVHHGAFAWGDYEGDGLLDLAVTGDQASGTSLLNPYGKLWLNSGTLAAGPNILRLYTSSIAWGDYDNDGDQDLAMAGSWSSMRYMEIYRNDGGSFTSLYTEMIDVGKCSIAWGDYDGDGDLDIALAGNSTSGRVTRVYENRWVSGYTVNVANAAPGAPTNLQVAKAGNVVTFSWDDSTDDTTPWNVLTYNLKVVESGGVELSPGMALADGTRLIPAPGTIRPGASPDTTSHVLTLPTGTGYTWSVQAIDAAFAGSAWAVGAGFDVP